MGQLVFYEIHPVVQHFVQDCASGGPEAVRAYLLFGVTDSAKGNAYRIVGEAPAGPSGAGEYINAAVLGERLQVAQQCQGLFAQWHYVWLTHFHFLGRNLPLLSLPVDFSPLHRPYFSGSLEQKRRQ